MATSGSYEGGAGGKFRKRLGFRRNATPYERPPTAIRNPIKGGRNGWISKIVDPASRIISKSAQMFFSSVFWKNLPVPPPVTEASHEPREPAREVDPIIPSSGANECVRKEGDYPSNSSGGNGINDLEQVLRQKTFTRAEIDRLMELLHSRTVDVSPDHGNRKSVPSTSWRATAQDNSELAHMIVQENGVDSQKLLGGISPPIVSPNALEHELASPAQLAKAYMGNRPSKVSPSTLGLRDQAPSQDVPLLTNIPFTPKSPSMSLGPRSVVRFAGVSENGYTTPGPRGRSAIYSMARKPYSRVHNNCTLKIDAHATPSTSSQLSWDNSTLSDGKQASKRRISILDNDIGSVGPIRRIRQKTSMMMSTSKNMILSTPGSSRSNPVIANGPYAPEVSTSSTQIQLPLEESKRNTSNLRQSENGHNSIPTTSFSSVPSQSTEMAQKILQQLDKLAPSPKQKSSELKLAAARDKSPSKLTVSMLQGQVLRSVEDVDSSKNLIKAQNPGTSDSLDGRSVSDARNSTAQKQDKVDENGPTKSLAFGDKLAPKANGVQTTQSSKDAAPSDKTSDSAISNSVARLPPKRAFQMSAHEDYLELDDDSDTGRVASTLFSAEKEKLGTSVLESKTIVAETVTVRKPFVSSETCPGSFEANGADAGASDGQAISKKDSGFAFSVTPVQPLLSVEKAELKEQTAPPMFSFASQSFYKVSQVETSCSLFGAKSELKPETSSSPVTLAATATETAPNVELGKSDQQKTEKAGDVFKDPENSVLSLLSTSTAPIIFAFGASTNSSLNNGLFASTTSMFTVPATPPASDTSSGVITSTATTTTTTTAVPAVSTNVTSTANANGSQSTSTANPTFPSAPAFQFGSSSSAAVVSSTNTTSLPLVTSGLEPTDSECNTKQTSPFGSLSLFGASSPSFTSAGNGAFGFGASAPSSTINSFANNQSQSSNPFASTTGSLFSAQGSPAETGTGDGTGVAPFTQSMPSQFGSSGHSPTFGLSGSSALSSSGFAFGSSAPGSELFCASSGFAHSSSTSFSTTAGSFSSGSGSSSLFSSSSQSATSSVFGSGFGSSSSPATTFAFGASTEAPAAGSASSPATRFSFGASAATPAGSADSPATGFSFGSSSAATPAGSAASPATGFSFGSSSSATPAAGSAPITFGASLGSSSGSTFSFTASAATTSSTSFSPSGSAFGTSNPVTAFGSASPSNDQMSMEDSMAEDSIQASAPVVSAFGRPANSPSPFTFGSPAPGGTPMFQFGGQQNPITPQSPSQFQTTGSQGFAAGGSFSIGSTGGGDKSGRKIIKIRRDKLWKR